MTDINSLVVEAFRRKAVRNAMLVDESFPTLAELINYGLKTLATDEEALASDIKIDEEKSIPLNHKDVEFSSSPDTRLNDFLARFGEAELASELYSAFHEEGIVCDVANKRSEWSDTLSARIADSDLVVLDLNLNGASDDASESIEIIRGLAKSGTFNLVVVYTKASDLQLSAKMVCGGLRNKRSVENHELESILPEILNSLDVLEAPIDQFPHWYLAGEKIDKEQERRFLRNVYKSHREVCKFKQELLEKVAEHILQKDFSVKWNSTDIPVLAADLNAANPWFLCENFFLCFAKKHNRTKNDGTKPLDLIPLIDKVIKSWNPGLTRVILSQIRNTVGRRGLEFLSGMPHDIETQISWLWHSTLNDKDSKEEAEAIESLVKTLLVSFTDKVVTDKDLTDFVRRSLGIIPRTGFEMQQLSEVSKPQWLGREGITAVSNNDILHALNVFQSSKRFDGKHITTGTILRLSCRDGDQISQGPLWLACVEPACDTVPHQAPKSEEWLHCRMLELFNELDDVVRDAHQGNHLFVKCPDGSRKYLSFRTKRGHPKIYPAFVSKNNQIEIQSDRRLVEVRFPLLGAEPSFQPVVYEVVTQLHDAYANRLLHYTGHHLSRIGLDFVSLAVSGEEEHG